jgi:hypothetical protein
VTGGAGTGAGQFFVSIVNPDNVIGGGATLQGVISARAPQAPGVVDSSGAVSHTVTLNVTLSVDQSGGAASAPPFGQIDTPAQNATGVVGAIGSFDINTTTLTNGLHTIAWGVTDSAGRVEGIGSRFFTVLNAGADAGKVSDPVAAGGERGVDLPPALSRLTGDVGAPVQGRVGFDLEAPFVPLTSDGAGVYVVQLDELGRLELDLAPGVTAGALLANGERRALPAGSHLDKVTGRFTWAPGAGYVGTYRLAFLTISGEVLVDVTVR